MVKTQLDVFRLKPNKNIKTIVASTVEHWNGLYFVKPITCMTETDCSHKDLTFCQYYFTPNVFSPHVFY